MMENLQKFEKVENWLQNCQVEKNAKSHVFLETLLHSTNLCVNVFYDLI